LQSLQVAVRGGVVTLSGQVATQNLAEEAMRLAAGQSGVKEVRNQIDFPPVAAVVPPPAEKPKTKPEPKPVTAKPVRERKVELAEPRGLAAQQRRQLQGLLAEGERLTNSGAYAAAIDTYNSALAIDPNDTSAKSGLNRARQAKDAEEQILRRRK
jgi:tetratricopeptide (TPR) repeat protein